MSRKEKRKRKKGHPVLKFILGLLLVLFVMMAGFVSYSTYVNGWGWQGLLATMMGHNQETLKDLEEFKVLILGVSKDIDVELTDTIMVASYDPKTQTATLLSIPRDTFVGKSKESANSYDKINALYQKSPEKTLEAVNNITGLDIEYYVVIDNNALIETVDAIGGVEFDVPIRMRYDDPTQDLVIDLQPGLQKIDGEKAEQLLRFRHNNDGTSYSSEYGDNDIGRMRTQREFIKETLRQTLQLKNIVKLRELLDIVYKNVKTNVQLSNVKDYIPYIVDFDTENIKTGTLPGTPALINKLWFFECNKTETKKLIQELFYDKEVNDADSTATSTTNTSSKDESTRISKAEAAKVKIELLNGSGSSQKLTEVTNLLKKKGYNIVKSGTTASNTKTTIIINTEVQEDILTNIKEILNINNEANSAINSTTKADITIIIGKDYK